MSTNRTLIAEIIVILTVVGVLLHDLNSTGLTVYSTMWPTILLVLSGSVALMLLIPIKPANSDQADPQAAQPSSRDGQESLRRYSMMALYAVYVMALPYLGFAVSTLLFIPVGAKLLDMPLTLQQIVIALSTAVGIYLLFQVAFHVPLPEGMFDIARRWF